METKIIGELKKYKIGKQYESNGKIFVKDGTIKGKLAEQRKKEEQGYSYRKVVIIKEENDMYAIPIQYLSPINEIETEINSEIDTLKDEIGDLTKEVASKGEKILKKEYFGFSGREILIGAVILIVLLKINK